MNFYSDNRDERSRRSILDMFWESNNYGLLANKEPMMMVPMRHEFFHQIPKNDKKITRKTDFSWMICLAGVFMGILVFGLFIGVLYVHKVLMVPRQPTVGSVEPKAMELIGTTSKSLMSLATISPVLKDAPCNTSFRTIGYYKGWDSHVISDSQLKKLSHVIFKYIDVSKNGTLRFKNNLEEIKFLDLKNRVKKFPIKFMISIQILNFADDLMVRLVNGITSFLAHHTLDGVDIDWRHPRPEDIPKQVMFVKKLREKLPENPFIISMTASGIEWKYYFRMNLKNLVEHIDFFNIFSFDYYTGNLTGPPAPLFSGIGEYRGYNVDRTMKYFACETGITRKLNMGIPFYGQYWNEVGEAMDKEEMWRTAKLKGGFIPWRAMKEWNMKKAKWNRNAMVPYIWDPEAKKFLSFENQKSLEKKMDYAKKKNLGGIVIESIGDDDDQGSLLSVVAENYCLEENNVVNYKCL